MEKIQDKNKQEQQLLNKIKKHILDKKKKERYQFLVVKLEADTISEAEHAEFMKLADLQEKLRNQRVKYLIELAQLRAISLPQLMSEMGLNSIANG
jgi:hypothetical protein